jgi:tryptophan 2,3-dioxygenase
MDDKTITRTEMIDLLNQTVGEMRAEMAAMKQEIVEECLKRVREAQSEIAKAFFPFQETTNVRFRAMEAKLSTSDGAMSALLRVVEGRLQEIEKRRLLNSSAA